jgi:hypothetical protein
LAERYFGSALELTSHDNYCPFWASDALDPNSRPVGGEDGESVVQVSQRVRQMFQVALGCPFLRGVCTRARACVRWGGGLDPNIRHAGSEDGESAV